MALTQTGNCWSAGGDINVNHFNIDCQDREAERKLQVAIEWLFELASINHYAIHSEAYTKLAPNTGSWILLEPKFVAWLNAESGTFWGVGIPGAGKTTLTSYVIHHLQERTAVQRGEHIVIFAYCRYNDALTTSKILSALLHQLCRQSAVALSLVCGTLYHSCTVEKKITPSLKHLSDTLSDALLRVSCRVSIVIDALDELPDDIRQSLVKILLSFKCSTFFTTRLIPIEGLGPWDINIHAHTRDLENFITSEIERLPNLRRVLKQREDVLDELIREITSKSDGMFLVAALQLSALSGTTSVKNLRKSIRALPSGLNSMYDFTLKRIMSKTEEEYTLACRALLWVAHSEEPLSTTELLNALLIDPEMECCELDLDLDGLTNTETLLTVCCGLLSVETVTETEIVRLIHYTTHDYLVSRREGLFKNPHAFAASTCAIYLELCGFFDSVVQRRPSTFEDEFPPVGSFAKYACKHLGGHASKSIVENNGDIPSYVHAIIVKHAFVPLSHPNVGHSGTIEWGDLAHFAALHGLLATLRWLKNDGTQIHSRRRRMSINSKGRTPLHYACLGGDLDVVRLLLLRAFNAGDSQAINHPDGSGNTALSHAVDCGQNQIVQLLLNFPGINADAENAGYTALWRASMLGNEQVVKMLSEFPGVDLNKKYGAYDWTALQDAVVRGHVKIVQHLINAGADCNGSDLGRCTALHLASGGGHESSVQLLLDSPAINIRAQNKNGSTALHFASTSGRDSIVKLLLTSPELAVNQKDNSGWTALHHATYMGHEGVVRLLLDHSEVDVNARAEGYYIWSTGTDVPPLSTAYDIAVQCGYKSIAGTLKRHGAVTKHRRPDSDSDSGEESRSDSRKKARLLNPS